VSIVLKLPKTEDVDWKTKLRRVDFLGAIVLVCAVFTLLLGLDRGSNVSWRAPITIASLCLAFPLFILFVLVELKVAAEPFAPARIVFERSLFACYLCNFFSFAGWLSVFFYVPLFFQATGEQIWVINQIGHITNISQTVYPPPRPASASYQPLSLASQVLS